MTHAALLRLDKVKLLNAHLENTFNTNYDDWSENCKQLELRLQTF